MKVPRKSDETERKEEEDERDRSEIKVMQVFGHCGAA